MVNLKLLISISVILVLIVIFFLIIKYDIIPKKTKDELAKYVLPNQKHVAHVYENGDTKKQLLARSRYLLFKSKSKWTLSQKKRAEILFIEFPELESLYNLMMMFRNIYEKSITKEHQKDEKSLKM
jgi:hypothetical protein